MIKFFNIKKQTLFLSLAFGLVFSACDESETCCKQDRIFQAKLVDSAVQGVEYHCGKIVERTDAKGTFACETLPVSFYIGNISLGSVSSIPNDKQIFPQDIAKVERNNINSIEVRKLALIFQSLDRDKNASNGIEITAQQSSLFREKIELNTLSIESVKEKLQAQDSTLIFKDIDKVMEHLVLSLGLSDVKGISDTNTSTVEHNTSSEENANNDHNISNENTSTETEEDNSSVEVKKDITAPATPTFLVTPTLTNEDSLFVVLQGEADAEVYLNGQHIGRLNGEGRLDVNLDTSGEDGKKEFELLIKDSSENASSVLTISINKDNTPPAQNATVDRLTTDDTSPALRGNLPHGETDVNTSKYLVVLNIEEENYNAMNNCDGTWSLEDDSIASLSMGYHDVNITVTDEANNSSTTSLSNQIEIDNTAFLIDSALEGIKYVSGSFTGYTDSDGLFKYDKGAGVTFYVGEESTGISLGTANVKVDPYNLNRRIITLFDLASTNDENNPRVVNMGKLLQSLDSDADVSNGISIDQQTKESMALLNLKNHIDFNQNIEEFHENSDIYNLMNDLAGHFGEHRGLLSTQDVQAHLVAVRDNTQATKELSLSKVSGTKEKTIVVEGLFKSINGGVEGLAYRSGNQFGRTDVDGAFKYEEGKKIKFSIYQLELGTTQAKAVISPADLIPSTSFNHPRPRNIIRLLNAFDQPNTPNTIVIDNAVRESLEKYRSQIDINLPDGKANAELGIAKGVDEFGAQFEDFEMGKEILDEIDRIRGA